MPGEDRVEQGVRVTHRLWGRTRGEKAQKALETLNPRFREFVNQGFSLYTGSALDPKTRSLCTLAALIVLGHEEEVKLHVYGALNNGATQEEIEELLMQMSVYGGVPVAINAWAVARRVFAKYQRPDDLP
ncbi:MAG: carboxymuconolactone decarboxylase family protein [Chloroflexi bacterium]|nr:carboxymuconolactone decarboxylase family protein [Chloroflexota bacterium]